MAAKARLHWLWRGAIAAMALVAANATYVRWADTNPSPTWLALVSGMYGWLDPWTGSAWAGALSSTVLSAPLELAVAFGVYGVTTPWCGQPLGPLASNRAKVQTLRNARPKADSQHCLFASHYVFPKGRRHPIRLPTLRRESAEQKRA